ATRMEAEGHARGLRRAAPQAPEIDVLGPAEAPLAVVAGRHRFRLLVHGARRSDIQGFLRDLLKAGPKPRGSVRVQVDIDPQSFL
ncbi:primosomal protein N', partial [Nitratireductor aquimarinus]|nr:primosomal protein N' [Nitratireductor aquimarinus]